MLQAITGMFRKKPYELPAQLIYTTMVDQARDPYFYRNLQVADSLDGRFDMIALHLYLVLDRLEDESGAKDLSQYMVNYMVDDVDRNFREMGISDMSVGKKVQKLAKALYGRLEAYQVSYDKIDADQGRGFELALCRNLYRSEEAGDLPLTQVRQYVTKQKEYLAAQNVDDFLKGIISFQKCGEFA